MGNRGSFRYRHFPPRSPCLLVKVYAGLTPTITRIYYYKSRYLSIVLRDAGSGWIGASLRELWLQKPNSGRHIARPVAALLPRRLAWSGCLSRDFARRLSYILCTDFPMLRRARPGQYHGWSACPTLTPPRQYEKETIGSTNTPTLFDETSGKRENGSRFVFI